jgi:transcription-repair coupling factor (superfamily II helicase)
MQTLPKTLITAYSESSRTRLRKILGEYNLSTKIIQNFNEVQNLKSEEFGLIILPTQRGFKTSDLTIITEQDLLGEKIIHKKSTPNKRAEKLLSEQSNIQEGELVIHRKHGLGRFHGLQTIKTENIINDYLKIEYANNGFLFVPIEDFNLVTRYGEFNPLIKLDDLGSVKWGEKKARVHKKLKEIADELIKLAVKRQLSKAPILTPNNGEYEEFCAKFPYTETEDQLKAIKEVEEDLAKGIPMDRLICGDVGFGKTEVALRAAFIASHNRRNAKQVAIITPTTLLCRQHFQEFTKRFAHTGLNVARLSRMVSPTEANKTKKEINNGTVDIVIGTHALLSDSIKFKNLGLVIIDEEQRFGVKQKEKIKSLRNNTHILTLSATPIPRTLQMSISGIRDLSLITTPPVDRLTINTFVMEYDDIIIREAIQREIFRGGRIFFITPRIKDIEDIEEKIKRVLPLANYKIAHGQMLPSKLDLIMNDFYDGKFPILISTAIVESGLDIPEANTMIIYRADNFGLAQLYQLRGRVGRGKIKAYAYLTIRPDIKISENAKKRLEVMQSLDALGAGFTIASNDMDIRGSGNLIGEEQSGHIRETGVELYNYLLKKAVENAKTEAGFAQEETIEDFSPNIKLGISTIISETYIHDLNLRMSFYKRISDAENEEEREELENEMIDRFGKIPPETQNLFKINILQNLCKKCGISELKKGANSIIISFYQDKFSNPGELIQLVMGSKEKISFREGKSVCFTVEREDWVKEANTVVKQLLEIKTVD